jgi:HKD family nuclease
MEQIIPFTGNFYVLADLKIYNNTSLQAKLEKVDAIIRSDSTYQSIVDNLKSLERANKLDVIVDQDVESKIKIALQELSERITKFNPYTAKYFNLLDIITALKNFQPFDGIYISFEISFMCYGENFTFDVIYKQGLCSKCKLFSATLPN